MRFGKLTLNELDECVLSLLGKKSRSEVVLSAAHGEDCAALKIEDLILVSTDPITAKMPLKELGRLSVDVACNDIVSNGGEPLSLLYTVIMPPKSSPCDIKAIMSSASTRAKELNVDIIGGHSEFSDCVTRAVVSVTAIGTTKRLLKKSDIKSNDKIFITKLAAIEGTIILSNDYDEFLNSSDRQTLEEFKTSLSVCHEGRILKNEHNVTSMHDITEGGVLGAVAEIAHGASIGAMIYEEKIPIHPLTTKLCKLAKIDPLRLISSGSLLFTMSSDSPQVLDSLKQAGINVVQIGQITNTPFVTLIKANGQVEQIESSCDHLFLALGSKNNKEGINNIE